jgi:hypothetical protein
MSISQLRDDFQKGLVEFLWDQWGQMGVSAIPKRNDAWATDPEALLLLTFEVGRGEPRLFEEVLDWMVVNERLISVQRLRNLAVDEADRALVEAVLGWLGENRRRPRLGARSKSSGADEGPRPFFRDSRLQTADPDPTFLAQGFLKPEAKPSGKSQAPNVGLPINFAFRLRLLLGVSARAEVARILLTTEAPRMNAQALAASTAYTKRNVQEATASLTAAGLVNSWVVGNENRFEAPRERWTAFLGVARLPGSRDWPQLFRAYRQVLRWLGDPANEDLSDYMLSSRARTLLEEVRPDLLFAGTPVNPGDSTQDLASFEQFVRGLMRDVLSVDL